MQHDVVAFAQLLQRAVPGSVMVFANILEESIDVPLQGKLGEKPKSPGLGYATDERIEIEVVSTVGVVRTGMLCKPDDREYEQDRPQNHLQLHGGERSCLYPYVWMIPTGFPIMARHNASCQPNDTAPPDSLIAVP